MHSINLHSYLVRGVVFKAKRLYGFCSFKEVALESYKDGLSLVYSSAKALLWMEAKSGSVEDGCIQGCIQDFKTSLSVLA